MTHFGPRRGVAAYGPKRGMYCYTASTIVNSEALISELENFLQARRYNELYFSINSSVLDEALLPAFIARMSAINVQVEAMCGTASWGTPAGLASMTTLLNKIKTTYNAAQPEESKFSAVHLDVEPWIGTGEDYSWIDPLIDAYGEARLLVDGSSLKLVADLSGVKIRNGSISQRQEIIDVLDKVVLMQYENTLAQAISRSLEFVSDLDITAHQEWLVALRAIDFSAPSAECFASIDNNFLYQRGYRGFVIYDYAAEKAKGP